MALVAIEDIFSAGARSTWMFLIENGQGCYIPAYQRPYSWDKDNVSRLFEDAAQGVAELMQRPSTISFLGTIIAIHDTKYETVEPRVQDQLPGRVMTIIDGQQRICTMQMLNIAFHEQLKIMSAPFAGSGDEAFKWIDEESRIRAADLEKAIWIDMNAGDGTYQFYPRIIRAMDDQWSKRQGLAKYVSPIGRLNWEYIAHVKEKAAGPFRYDPQDAQAKLASHQSLAETLRYIQREIVNICAGKPSEHGLPTADVLAANDNIGNGLWGHGLPAAVSTFVHDGASHQRHAEFCKLLKLIVLSRYMNTRMAFTIVTTKGEEDAFNMFEALNTTGEPLTAFETLKPKIISAETMATYAGSPSFAYVNAIGLHLDRFKKADEKQSATSDLLVPFALAECGEKRSKRLSEQRRFLRDTYEGLGNLDAKRDFLYSLSNLATFMRTAWSADEVASFAPLAISDDTAELCFDALRDLKHAITIAPLVRFFDAACRARVEDRKVRTDELAAAIKATAAFSMLWRGAKGGTENIDSVYRELMRLGVKSLNIAPFAKRVGTQAGVLAIEDFRSALRHMLVTEGGYADKAAWVRAAAHTPIYTSSRVVTRFLLFCATDEAVPDAGAPGLVVRGRPGVAPLFTLENWRKDDYYTVEHIVAQRGSNHWPSSFYDDPDLVDRLGNALLLPEEANNLVGNRSWAHKRMFYELLAAETVADQARIKGEMAKIGLILSKKGESMIEAAGYNKTCQALTKVTGDWSVALVEARSKRLAELAWDKLASWLGWP